MTNKSDIEHLRQVAKDTEHSRQGYAVNLRMDVVDALIDARRRLGVSMGQLADAVEMEELRLTHLLGGGADITLVDVADLSWALGLIPKLRFEIEEEE